MGIFWVYVRNMWTATFQPHHPLLMRKTRSNRYLPGDQVSAGELRTQRFSISTTLRSRTAAKRSQTQPHKEAIVKQGGGLHMS